MKKLQIINAVIWATTLLVFAYLFKGQDNAEYFSLFLILCSSITTLFITKSSKSVSKTKC